MPLLIASVVCFLLGMIIGLAVQAERNRRALIKYFESTTGKQVTNSEVLDNIIKVVQKTNT